MTEAGGRPAARLLPEWPNTHQSHLVLRMPDIIACSFACRDVTIEYQRQRAKEMRQYFQDRQQEAQVRKGP